MGFHLYEVPRIGRFIATERRIQWEMGTHCLMGTEFMFGTMQYNNSYAYPYNLGQINLVKSYV